MNTETTPAEALASSDWLGRLESYFQLGLCGNSDYLPDDRTRARWLVAEALRAAAKKEDRSMAARLRLMAGDVENGIHPSKKVFGKVGAKRLDAAYREFRRLAIERLQRPNDEALRRGEETL